MVSLIDVRELALGLPETVEQDHHGRPSFRVGGKIFATLPGPTHVNVMLDFDGVAAAIEHPSRACTQLHWGQRLAGVQVDLRRATAGLLEALLADAWARKATKRLRQQHAARGPSR